jgi:hypothetical protein
VILSKWEFYASDGLFLFYLTLSDDDEGGEDDEEHNVSNLAAELAAPVLPIPENLPAAGLAVAGEVVSQVAGPQEAPLQPASAPQDPLLNCDEVWREVGKVLIDEAVNIVRLPLLMLSDGTVCKAGRIESALEYWRLMFPMRNLPALLSHSNADNECMYRVESLHGATKTTVSLLGSPTSTWQGTLAMERHWHTKT